MQEKNGKTADIVAAIDALCAEIPGRQEELEELKQFLLSPAIYCAVVCGNSGVGKTFVLRKLCLKMHSATFLRYTGRSPEAKKRTKDFVYGETDDAFLFVDEADLLFASDKKNMEVLAGDANRMRKKKLVFIVNTSYMDTSSWNIVFKRYAPDVFAEIVRACSAQMRIKVPLPVENIIIKRHVMHSDVRRCISELCDAAKKREMPHSVRECVAHEEIIANILQESPPASGIMLYSAYLARCQKLSEQPVPRCEFLVILDRLTHR